MYEKQYFVYILTNKSATLYVGVTNDLLHRVAEHRAKALPGFTATYNINRLIYFEMYRDPETAIAREKELKGWRRSKKIGLIKSVNPLFRDLYNELSS